MTKQPASNFSIISQKTHKDQINRKPYRGRKLTNDSVNIQRLTSYMDSDRLDQFKYFRTITNYKKLIESFEWNIRTFRAGVIIIYKQGGIAELLLIHQNEVECVGKNGTHIIPSRRGLPKGSAENYEIYYGSAFDTASRELYEETGIDITLCGSAIMPSIFICPYSQDNIREVHIFFTVIFNERPEIYVNGEETVNYEWINIYGGLRGIVTNYTTHVVLTTLEEVNILNDEIHK